MSEISHVFMIPKFITVRTVWISIARPLSIFKLKRLFELDYRHFVHFAFRSAIVLFMDGIS